MSKKLRQFVKRWKERHPCIMRVAKFAGMGRYCGGGLVYLDLITDVIATDAMYHSGRSDWALVIGRILIPIFGRGWHCLVHAQESS